MPSPYADPKYRRIRNMLLGSGVLCAHCQRVQATELDHDPPLAMHKHRPHSSCCRLIPSCHDCNHSAGMMVKDGTWRPGMQLLTWDQEPERAGVPLEDERWDVPWLAELRALPENAVWPRLMTLPHPLARGSLGPEFCAFAEERSQRALRWWQRLVAARLLEVDDSGRLVWETLVLTVARQLGKSWFLRELCLWRIHQGERFQEPQDVLHTGKDLAICKEVQRPARVWAKLRSDRYKVREVNGQEEIELLEDGSRWMLRAKEAAYGYAISMAAADEAWAVKARQIEDGITPTMVEREQPQLLLVSTAHRLASGLMLGRRRAAIASLEQPEGLLLIEWSAPESCDLDDEAAWRQASPHWTPHRKRHIQSQLDLTRSGEIEDPDEPDPEQSFRAQWLNQWPRRVTRPSGATDSLLPEGLWDEIAEPALVSEGPVWVAVEDNYGHGASVAACARLEDGRFELDGWLCESWDAAMLEVRRLTLLREVRGISFGDSMIGAIPSGLNPSPVPASSRDTRTGLAVLRELAMAGLLVHDGKSKELRDVLHVATIREQPTGLYLLTKGRTDLVRAAVWALQAAYQPIPVPAIH